MLEQTWLYVRGADSNDFKDWMTHNMQSYKGDDIMKICMVCLSIWKNRDDIVWNQKGMEFIEVVTSSVSVLSYSKNAHDKSFNYSFGFITHTDDDVHWKRPLEDTIMVNTDAALLEDSNCYSYAMIARDHEGNMSGAVSNCKQGNIDPEFIEAIGIRQTLSWVKTKAWPKVVVETDCVVVTHVIRCSSMNLSYLGRVLNECKTFLSDLGDRKVILKFVKRYANKMTHFIARHNSSLADRSWRGGNAHSDFIHVLLNDLKV